MRLRYWLLAACLLGPSWALAADDSAAATNTTDSRVKYSNDTLPYVSLSHRDIRFALADHREEFYKTVEEVLLPKIVQDIDDIVRNGWATEVSTKDLCHVHLLVSADYPLDKARSYPEILNGRDVSILYHSHEYDGHWDSPYRNILSSLYDAPRTVPGKLKGTLKDAAGVERDIMSVDNGDLNSWYMAELEFGYTPEERSAYLTEFKKTLQLGGLYFGLNTNF
ncbi:MAG: hypothetical protein WCU88_06820 [Elusimicrobiota bacterium]|jgi:hypothetical protein